MVLLLALFCNIYSDGAFVFGQFNTYDASDQGSQFRQRSIVQGINVYMTDLTRATDRCMVICHWPHSVNRADLLTALPLRLPSIILVLPLDMVVLAKSLTELATDHTKPLICILHIRPAPS